MSAAAPVRPGVAATPAAEAAATPAAEATATPAAKAAATPAAQVAHDSHLTLHYRIALADGAEVISTFGANPATLRLGSGQLAANLERCLVGLPEGARRAFRLAPEAAFGAHNPQLLQRIAKKAFPAAAVLESGKLIEFEAPGGAGYAGLVLELDETHALIDFNHPLAGQAIRFEVEVIGVLGVR
jgi:FKBP-type peptidyl-prolyl cis-trans isomerase SlpA